MMAKRKQKFCSFKQVALRVSAGVGGDVIGSGEEGFPYNEKTATVLD